MDFKNRREELWETFEKSLRFSEENGVEIVLISGDLYENETITKSHLDRLAILFKKYDAIRFFISLGNHDYISDKSEYLDEITSKNVTIFKSEISYVEYKNVRVYGFSWDRLYYSQMPFSMPPVDRNYYNILMVHGMDERVSDYMPLNINFLENSGFNYVALGHIHNPKKVGEVSYYPGALEPLSYKCVGEHGGYLVDTSNETVDFIDFAKRHYNNLKIDISDIENNRELFIKVYETLNNYSPEDIFRVYFEGRKSKTIDLDEVGRALNRDFKYLDIKDVTKPRVNFEKILADDDTLASKYFNYIFNNFNDDIKAQKTLVDIGLDSLFLGDYYED